MDSGVVLGKTSKGDQSELFGYIATDYVHFRITNFKSISDLESSTIYPNSTTNSFKMFPTFYLFLTPPTDQSLYQLKLHFTLIFFFNYILYTSFIFFLIIFFSYINLDKTIHIYLLPQLLINFETVNPFQLIERFK